MRDTELLRRRLWAQLGLPLATVALMGTTACDSGTKVKPVKVSDIDDPTGAEVSVGENGKKPRPKADKLPDSEGAVASTTYAPPARVEDIAAGEFDYFGPPRDPFNAHDEEEGCPSGDWCGSPEDARLFSVKHIPDQLECPSKILSDPKVTNGLDKKEKRWEGLSFHPMMQGRLMTSVTKDKREEGKDKSVCCYHWFEYCSGRPLLDGETMVVAQLREGASWSCEPAEVAAPAERPDSTLSPEMRERLGQLWVDDALMEHAAIAAFERATLELMAMAAPPTLLAEVQTAAADEVNHATRCFGLAARFSGRQREPGPLVSLEPRVRGLSGREADDPAVGEDWVRLALDTFIEGCVGETIAALVARRAQRRCEDPATMALLEEIVEDEGRHAGLAWQTIEWVLEASGSHREAVLAALEQQAEAMAAEARKASDPVPAADPEAGVLARYGRCDRRMELLARRDAWTDLILPTLLALGQAADGQGPIART